MVHSHNGILCVCKKERGRFYGIIFQSSLLRGPRSNDTTVSGNAPSNQILVSEFSLQQKEREILVKMAHFRFEAETIQSKPEHSTKN